MTEQHFYYMILLIETNLNCFFHWELFKTEQEAEEAAYNIVNQGDVHDVMTYKIKPIPVRSSWS